MITPYRLYEHDCERCVYYGSIAQWDIYVCTDEVTNRTLILRDGSEPGSYCSRPEHVWDKRVVDGKQSAGSLTAYGTHYDILIDRDSIVTLEARSDQRLRVAATLMPARESGNMPVPSEVADHVAVADLKDQVKRLKAQLEDMEADRNQWESWAREGSGDFS